MNTPDERERIKILDSIYEKINEMDLHVRNLEEVLQNGYVPFFTQHHADLVMEGFLALYRATEDQIAHAQHAGQITVTQVSVLTNQFQKVLTRMMGLGSLSITIGRALARLNELSAPGPTRRHPVG